MVTTIVVVICVTVLAVLRLISGDAAVAGISGAVATLAGTATLGTAVQKAVNGRADANGHDR